MRKKPKRMKATTQLNLRCKEDDKKAFQLAAEKEGFGGNVSAWILYHLRRQSRDTLKNE